MIIPQLNTTMRMAVVSAGLMLLLTRNAGLRSEEDKNLG